MSEIEVVKTSFNDIEVSLINNIYDKQKNG